MANTTTQSRKPSMVEHSEVQQINMRHSSATRRRRRRSSMEPMHKRRASSNVSGVSNGNSASGALSITPSLSSILNQRKSQKTNNESKHKTNYYYHHTHLKRQTNTCPIKKSHKEQMHPLNDMMTPRYCGSEEFHDSADNSLAGTPQVQIFNDLQDLDLYTEMTLNDVVQFYSPVQTYISPEAESLHQDSTNSLVSLSEHDSATEDEEHNACIELESIATQKHQSLSPHFMLLYSMEQNMKKTQLLPELDVDELLLAKLSVQDIWNLDIPEPAELSADTNEGCKSIAAANTSPNDTDCPTTTSASTSIANSNKHAWKEEDSIKLALITRKKLWCDMIQNSRLDTFGGDNLPWNKKFVYNATGSTASGETSLVRLNSRKAPWMHVTDSSFSPSTPTPSSTATGTANKASTKMPEKLQQTTTHQMIKPCGVLNKGRIQYVVKGWCDSRFLS
ncbi:hypothetical protein ACO0QE_002768 [Hanseniaspora vineae]